MDKNKKNMFFGVIQDIVFSLSVLFMYAPHNFPSFDVFKQVVMYIHFNT